MGKTLQAIARELDSGRERRPVCHTAQGRLALFLAEQDPLIRRLLTGEGLHAFDNIAFLAFDGPRRRQFDQAQAQYFVHLKAVVNEGPPKGPRFGRVNSEFLEVERYAAAQLTQLRGRGAPPKPLDDRFDVVIARSSDRLRIRLELGFRVVKALRASKRFSSDPAEMRRILAAERQGYEPDEIEALVVGNSLRSVTAHLLAKQLSRDVATIQAAITRGRRLLRTTMPPRRRIL